MSSPSKIDLETDRAGSNSGGLKSAGTIIFVGHARLPQSLAPRDASPVVSVEIEADVTSGVIVQVATKAVPDLGAQLLAAALQGQKIQDGPVAAVDTIRRRYICPSQKAMATAVLNAFEAYNRYRQLELAQT